MQPDLVVTVSEIDPYWVAVTTVSSCYWITVTSRSVKASLSPPPPPLFFCCDVVGEPNGLL